MIVTRHPETASDKDRKRKHGNLVAAGGSLGSVGLAIGYNKLGNLIGSRNIDKKIQARIKKVPENTAKLLESGKLQKEVLLKNKMSNSALGYGTLGILGSLAAGKIVKSRKVKHKNINDDNPKYNNTEYED